MAGSPVAGPVDGRRWHTRHGVHYRALVDGGILYDEEEGQVHHLNATAALVWEACQQGATLPELVSCVRIAYEVAPRQAEQDVTSVLGQLEKSGVLK